MTTNLVGNFIKKYTCNILIILFFISTIPIIRLVFWEVVLLIVVLTIMERLNKKHFSIALVLAILVNCLAYYSGNKFAHRFVLYYDKSVVVCNVREKDVSQCLQDGQGKLKEYEYLGRFWTK